MNQFPTGNAAYQERYIEAFRGLTQRFVAVEGRGGSKDLDQKAIDIWWEMFNTLIKTEDESDGEEASKEQA